MTEATTPNSDTPADPAANSEDTALAAAAVAATQSSADPTDPDPAKAPEADGGKAEGEGETKVEEVAGAPEAYDTAAFALPEGIEFDTEGFAAMEPALRELDLSQEKAGKLVSTFAEKVVPLIEKRTADRFDEAAAELRANLARDLQADPEVGGKKLDENRSYAAKAIAHFIPKAEERSQFSTFLNESGLGNHPLLMRLVAGAGRTLAEASTPTAETASAPLTESQKFYGKGGS